MARSHFRRRGTKATQATISQFGLKDQLDKAMQGFLLDILRRRATRD